MNQNWSVNRYILMLLCLLFLFSATSYAQEEKVEEKKKKIEEERKKKDEKKVEEEREKRKAATDTSRVSGGKKEEKTKRIKVTSKLYWYDLEDNLHVKEDTSRYSIFRLSAEKDLIYTDMSDIFRSPALWFDYDLGQEGRPAYIAMTNTYPRQTNFLFGSAPMNDYLNSKFNTQFIPLNYIWSTDADITLGNIKSSGRGAGTIINVTPNSIHPEIPWTKIYYKQGSYGYGDVDVHFAFPISGNMAVQLGGMHKVFDGAYQDSDYEGENYRAELTWQYSPNLYLRGQIFLNRNEAGLAANIIQNIPYPNNKEDRNDYFLDLTWIQNDTTRQRLHLLFFHSTYSRQFRDRYSTYKLETWSGRYGIDANYNLPLDSSELLIGGSAVLPSVSGYAFKEKQKKISANAFAKVQISLSSSLQLRGAGQIVFSEDYPLHILPTAGADLDLTENQRLSLDISRGIRFPGATERFFNFDTLYGNPELKEERNLTIHGKYLYQLTDKWHLKVDGGFHKIDKEILWADSSFYNSGSRDFIFFGLEAFWKIWQLDFTIAGQYTLADQNLTPRSNIWGQAHLNYTLLNGALILDAFGTAYYYDKHLQLNYEPRLDWFYASDGNMDSFFVLNWKFVATIGSANLFLEMENALGKQYEYIYGYPLFYRSMRLGVNWILWD